MAKLMPKTVGAFKFAIDADDFVTYATAFNGEPVIKALAIQKSEDSKITDVTIEVRIQSLGHDLATVWRKTVGSIGSEVVRFEDLSLDFRSDLLFQQNEAVAANLTVTLKSAEGFEIEAMWVIHVHSPDTWIRSQFSNDILAAFVQPNHPVLREIQDRAVKILGHRGEETLLPGYQIPAHVRPMVEALYQAVVDLEITYSDPPASWDLPSGQKIRSAPTILNERVATCLDSAILFASLLEAVGLCPIVALIPRHAFVGYWTAKFSTEFEDFPTWTELPIADVMNLVDLGFIELFETTSICKGSMQLPYEKAIGESHGRISGTDSLDSAANFSTFINVVGCRGLKPRPIRPIPALFAQPDGSIEVIEYKPTEFTVDMLREKLQSEGAQGRIGSATVLDVPPVVKKWLDSLLDLSARSPLINFKERSRTCAPLLTAPGLVDVIEDLLQNGATLALRENPWSKKDSAGNNLEVLDARGNFAAGTEGASYLSESLSKNIVISKFNADNHRSQLMKLVSSAKTFYEETGSNGLYLALGSLSWKTRKENRNVRSPLILIPVSITPKNRSKEFYLSFDEGNKIMPNFSLYEKLVRDEGIKLEQLVNLQEDDSGIDIDGTFEYVRKKIAESGLQNCRVDENAVISIFNFSTYRLWRDLLDNWDTFQNNSLVSHFINSSTKEFVDPTTTPPEDDLDALLADLPIPADASQARAISTALAGRTFILQGPPGTGKSQTITNLLAKALRDGKRVLFVAQKKDALDVVKKRLDESGLGAFSLDLHDKGMNPKIVKEQLLNVIDIAISADPVGFESAQEEYQNASAPLQKYRDRLHEVGRLGESIHSVLDKRLAVPGTSTLPLSGEFIANSKVADKTTLHSSARNLAEIGPQAGIASTNPWSLTSCISPSIITESDVLKGLFRSLRESLLILQRDGTILTFLEQRRTLQELSLSRIIAYQEFLNASFTELSSPHSKEILKNARISLESARQGIIDIGIDISRLEILDVDNWMTRTSEAETSFVLIRGMKLNGILKKVSKILGVSLSTDRTKLLTTLQSLKKLKNQINQAKADLEKVTGMRSNVAESLFNLDVVDTQLRVVARLSEIGSFVSMSGVDEALISYLQKNSETETVKAFLQISEISTDVFSRLEASSESTELWLGGSKFGSRLVTSIPQWAEDALEHSFAQLTRWITLINDAKPFMDLGLKEAHQALLSGAISYADAPNAFLRGYYQALEKSLIVERGFNTFEAMTLNKQIKRLEEAHFEIRKRLPRITGTELLERRGFDSSMKVGAIGDLLAALKQPRGRIPIRTLLAKHWGIVTRVTPCVLASPDSCVRFIEPNLEPFDLVVFDEASQIRVAHAIGSMGRAKSVIIVGDSKQMPPTSVAQVRVSDDEDNEEQTAEELLTQDSESILDYCENARVPDIMLNWHYRSEDESLIAFSNTKYYKGRLNSFPSPSNDKSLKGLSFKYVEHGQFLRRETEDETELGPERTNPAEAEEIVRYLAERLKDPSTRNDSIGIVTLNKPQMDFIKDKLERSEDPEIQRAMTEGVGGEEIFVKNLESVQGSERDVILFSVAFSKNIKGELPLNFGPLNNVGGERRLNVAITRARKQIRIFCSFKPDELINRNPASKGVSHLAQYLKMAAKESDDFVSIFSTHESHPDRIRMQILEALRKEGLNVIEEVGMSDFKVDIAVLDPQDSTKAILGILLDGQRWNARETVSDRDCLSVSLLRDRMGWPAIERIWMASWLRNPADEVKRIREAYEKATSLPKERRTEVNKSQTVKTEPIFTKITPEDLEESENPIDRLLDDVDEWLPLQVQIIGMRSHLDRLYAPALQQALQEVADVLTQVEGPVSPDRLAKYVGSCFGFDRIVGNRAAAINAVPYPGHDRDEENFLYPRGEGPYEFSIWRRGTEHSKRSVFDISLVEISNAMGAICEVAHGVRPEQLVKEVSRFFGIVKVSSAINQRLSLAMNRAITRGTLVLVDDYIQLP